MSTAFRTVSSPQRACSFTLIELLVVVAIIAVLASILLPSLQQAKERGKRATCMMHMKQVAVALLLLSDENDGWINGINSPYDSSGGNTASNWIIAVAPYLGGGTNSFGHAKKLSVYDDVTYCPGRKKSYFDPSVGQSVEGNFPYGVNSLFSGNQSTPMHSLREVVHASRIYLISDCYTPWPESVNCFVHQTLWTLDGSWGSGVWIRPRHPAKPSAAPGVREVGNGLNWVFVDGHGEFLQRTSTANWYDVEWYRYGQATLWPGTGTYDMSGE